MFSFRSLFWSYKISEFHFYFTSVEVLPSEGWMSHLSLSGSCMERLVKKCKVSVVSRNKRSPFILESRISRSKDGCGEYQAVFPCLLELM